MPNCRDEAIAAFEQLIGSHTDRPFTAREVNKRMSARGTSYAELTVCRAMKRMKEPNPRRLNVLLERARESGL